MTTARPTGRNSKWVELFHGTNMWVEIKKYDNNDWIVLDTDNQHGIRFEPLEPGLSNYDFHKPFKYPSDAFPG